MPELELAEYYELQNQIVTLKLKGLNESQIARELNIKRNVVLEHLGEWKQIAQNDETIKDRAREALLAMDNHYALIIKELWNLVEQSDTARNFAVKNSALKNLVDTEAKRVDLLQKSGILDGAVLGTEMAAVQERMDSLKSILKEVTSQCSHCRSEVARRLRQTFGASEAAMTIQEKSPGA